MRQNLSKILVIEDDLKIAYGLVRGLEDAGFDARSASDGERGLELVFEWEPDLVVLDLMLPKMNGHELLAQCQARTSVPFVVLTARAELDARLESFELGAVDFMAKPFWLEELVARIRARLSTHIQAESRDELTWSEVTLDFDARTVHRDEQELALTPHELNLLVYLARRPGRALTRAQLAQGALSMHGDVSDRTVDSHIARVRKKLGAPASAAICTVWGIGYRFEPES